MYRITVDNEISEEVRGTISQTDTVFIPLVSSARTDAPAIVLTASFKDTVFEFSGLVFSDIDWGDGATEKYDGDKLYRHTYSRGDILNIKIYGADSVPAIVFSGNQQIIGISTRLNIEAGAFAGCWNLTTVELLEGVEYIGNEAFVNTSINHLIVPRSVTYLGNCFNQNNIVIELLQPDPEAIEISVDLFANSYDTCKIIVPYGSYKEYVTAYPVRRSAVQEVEQPQMMRFNLTRTVAAEAEDEYPWDAPVVLVIDASLAVNNNVWIPQFDISDLIGEVATIDWGDGIIEEFAPNTGSYSTHKYTDSIETFGTSIFTVKIYGVKRLSSYLDGVTPSTHSYNCINDITLEFYSSVSEASSKIFTKTYYTSSIQKIYCPYLQKLYPYSFEYCTNLTYIYLPKLTELGYTTTSSAANVGVFEHCTAIRVLDLPSLTTGLEGQNLAQLTSLQYLSLDSYKDLPNSAVVGCDQLLEVNLPSIETIATYGIYNNASLVNINLGPSLKTIAQEGLAANPALTELVIPSAESIEAQAFERCTNLTRLKLPDNLRRLGACVCEYTSVRELHIPASTETINVPFTALSAPQYDAVYIDAVIPPIMDATASSETFTGPIYVPPESYNLYVNHVNWGTYDIRPRSEQLLPPVVKIGKSGVAQWLDTNELTNPTFEYIVDSGEPIQTTETSLKLTAGQSLQVRAVGDGLYTTTSEFSGIQIYEPDKIIAEPLKVPVVQISKSGMAYWLAANASSYVYIIDDGEPISTISTSVQLLDGEFIEVKAVGDGLYFADSDYSEPLQYDAAGYVPSVLPVPVVQISKTGFASWICANASGYIYEIDGVETETLGTAIQLLPNQKIRVKALGDGYNYSDSVYSDYHQYTVELEKLETPVVSISVTGQASWICVNASGYYYKINGTERFTLSTVIQLNPDDIIEVKGAGDGINYSDSDYSEPVQYVIRPDVIAKTPFDRHAYLSDLPNFNESIDFGTSVFVEGKKVDEFNADVKADKATVDKQLADLNSFTDSKYLAALRYTDQKAKDIEGDISELQDSVNDRFIESDERIDAGIAQATAYSDTIFESSKKYTDAKQEQAITYTDGKILELRQVSGSRLILTVDPMTFVLTAIIQNPDGTEISKQTIDLPLEEMTVGASFNSETQTIVLQLKSGGELRVPVGSLVSGLVSQEAFDEAIARLECKKEIVVVDITKMITEQDATLFMDLSNRFANGEIAIVGSLNGQVAVVNSAAIIGNSANWAAVVSTWTNSMIDTGEFDPNIVVYGFECDGEKIFYNVRQMPITEYVKFTDYSTETIGGVVKTSKHRGVWTLSSGLLELVPASDTELKNRAWYMPVTGGNLDKAFKVSATDNKETWTDDDKKSARDLIGAVGNTDYATTGNVGVMKIGAGLMAAGNGSVVTARATETYINAKEDQYRVITPKYLDYATMSALADCKKPELWTDDTTAEDGTVTKGTKTKACELLGALHLLPSLSTPFLYLQLENGTIFQNRVSGQNYNPVSAVFRLQDPGKTTKEPVGTAVASIPKGDWDATPRKYVDNLPDYLTLTDDEKAKWADMVGATKYYLHNLTLKLGFDNQFTGEYEEMEWSCTIKSVVKGKLFGLNDNEKYSLLYKLFMLGEQNAFNGHFIQYEGINGNNEISSIDHTIIGLTDDGLVLSAVIMPYGTTVYFDINAVIDDAVSEINIKEL